MARLVDHEAVLADFEQYLVEDGRPSHGTDHLVRKLAEIRAKHRVNESAERAFLRRFSSHFTETFLGLVPRPATDDPLSSSDPAGTFDEMAAGASPDHTTEGSPCQSSPKGPDFSRRASSAPSRSASPATT